LASRENLPTDVKYLDFEKAFDKVSHKRLMLKLKNCGLSGNVYNFIKDFLSNRSQQVIVNGILSIFTNVSSGIPQGSILGSLLFIIFINDFPSCFTNECKIFADDTKIYSVPGDSLQTDLDNALQWADQWQMTFNSKKNALLCILDVTIIRDNI